MSTFSEVEQEGIGVLFGELCLMVNGLLMKLGVGAADFGRVGLYSGLSGFWERPEN